MKSQHVDRRLPADHIVFMRGSCDENNHVIDWIIERTEDATIVASGSLEAMMFAIELYPNGRRATWAEDCSRLKPSVFYVKYTYGGENI